SLMTLIATDSSIPNDVSYDALYTTENPPLPTSSMFLKLSYSIHRK
ncbi:19758_t:CDS:1, partial [Cetraspora pellucida]